jgi:hypothetical protein
MGSKSKRNLDTLVGEVGTMSTKLGKGGKIEPHTVNDRSPVYATVQSFAIV